MKKDVHSKSNNKKIKAIEWAAFSEAIPEGYRNEDSVICDAENGLFLVADGMGGRPGGNIASKIGAEAFKEALKLLDVRKRLETAALQAVSKAPTPPCGRRDLRMNCCRAWAPPFQRW